MWLWYKPHAGFVDHIHFKHIYLYIQKPHIEYNDLPHAIAFAIMEVACCSYRNLTYRAHANAFRVVLSPALLSEQFHAANLVFTLNKWSSHLYKLHTHLSSYYLCSHVFVTCEDDY